MNSKCEISRAALSKPQRSEKYCRHLKLADDASKAQRYARVIDVDTLTLSRKLADEELQCELQENSVDGRIQIYILPADNIVVPSINDVDSYVHVR